MYLNVSVMALLESQPIPSLIAPSWREQRAVRENLIQVRATPNLISMMAHLLPAIGKSVMKRCGRPGSSDPVVSIKFQENNHVSQESAVS
jgi:hypothetical protein